MIINDSAYVGRQKGGLLSKIGTFLTDKSSALVDSDVFQSGVNKVANYEEGTNGYSPLKNAFAAFRNNDNKRGYLGLAQSFGNAATQYFGGSGGGAVASGITQRLNKKYNQNGFDWSTAAGDIFQKAPRTEDGIDTSPLRSGEVRESVVRNPYGFEIRRDRKEKRQHDKFTNSLLPEDLPYEEGFLNTTNTNTMQSMQSGGTTRKAPRRINASEEMRKQQDIKLLSQMAAARERQLAGDEYAYKDLEIPEERQDYKTNFEASAFLNNMRKAKLASLAPGGRMKWKTKAPANTLQLLG